jgi:CRISPR-associated protein Csb2
VIDHLIVSAPSGFDRDELLALHRLAPLAFPSREHPSRLIPVAVGRRATLFQELVCKRFRGATPFLPTRHYRAKRDGDFLGWIRRQVEKSLADHGMPRPMDIKPIQHLPLEGGRQVRWLEFRRSRQGDRPEIGFGFELILETSVNGPFSIGACAHFGLGMFVPICVEGEGNGGILPQ